MRRLIPLPGALSWSKTSHRNSPASPRFIVYFTLVKKSQEFWINLAITVVAAQYFPYCYTCPIHTIIKVIELKQ